MDENLPSGAWFGSSGFADGRHEVSPDSEQILLAGTKYRKQNSVSVEQIQDSPAVDKRGQAKACPFFIDKNILL